MQTRRQPCWKKTLAVVVVVVVVPLFILLHDHDSSCHAYSHHQANTKNKTDNKVWNVVIVGGRSGMGKAAALAALQRGGTVLLVGRIESKLFQAKCQLLEQLPDAVIFTRVCDASDESAVATLAREIETCTAPSNNNHNNNEEEEHPI